ncbi:uncharacterized protein LOC144616112 [Panthera onca]
MPGERGSARARGSERREGLHSTRRGPSPQKAVPRRSLGRGSRHRPDSLPRVGELGVGGERGRGRGGGNKLGVGKRDQKRRTLTALGIAEKTLSACSSCAKKAAFLNRLTAATEREKTVILTNNYTHLWGKSSWTDTSQTQSRDACGKIEGKKYI